MVNPSTMLGMIAGAAGGVAFDRRGNGKAGARTFIMGTSGAVVGSIFGLGLQTAKQGVFGQSRLDTRTNRDERLIF